MIVRLGALRFRIERLPAPARPRYRWDGSDQAYPFTMPARVGAAMRSLGAAMSLAFVGELPQRRRPDYLRRHL